jgi:S-methylmethionine-dependent homocysteine/selenocysteine methylase
VTVTILDGPMGTELLRRGVPTPLPLWSATALETAPEVIAAIHADYAAAGARVHTANTFRTGPYPMQKAGRRHDATALTRKAVALARAAVPPGQRVAGSLAPLEDCYRPDLSPAAVVRRAEHRAMAELLADAGVDLLICETFPHPEEAIDAVQASVATALPTWLGLTLGPEGDLLGDDDVIATARCAFGVGAEAVLLNCSRVSDIDRLLPRLARLGVVGAYGNVGAEDPVVGWRNDGDAAPGPYSEAAARWIAMGAAIVGGCCGTGPAHIAEIARRMG